MEKILIIGAAGQLGSELTLALRNQHGNERVIATDIRLPESGVLLEGPFEKLDASDVDAYQRLLRRHKITQVYHLAAVLSARAESHPLEAWKINMDSLLAVLESGRNQVKKIYWPSSIAVFGPDTPKDHTPQYTLTNPTTVYGISKLAGERWCEYYFNKYGVDVRSIRYPGLIGYKTSPGGGTTDYAVEIFWKAIANEAYTCFLDKDSALPMMYIDDAISGTIDLMNTDPDRLTIRSSYNLAAMSFTPAQLLQAIQKHLPNFQMTYAPDFRQKIADSWPNSIDDRQAKEDWKWSSAYDLDQLVLTMIEGVGASVPAK